MGSWGEMFQTAAAAADSIEDFEEQYGSAPPILIGSDYHAGYPGKKGRGKGRKGGKAKAHWQARSFQKEPKQDQEEAISTQSEVLAKELAMLRKRVRTHGSSPGSGRDRDPGVRRVRGRGVPRRVL